MSSMYYVGAMRVIRKRYQRSDMNGTMRVLRTRTDYNEREKEKDWHQRYHWCATRYLSTLSSGTMTALRAVPDERYYHFGRQSYVNLNVNLNK